MTTNPISTPRLTEEEWLLAAAFDDNPGVPFELAPGKFVTVRGCEKDQYIRLARRNEAIKASLVMPLKVQMRLAKKRSQGIDAIDDRTDDQFFDAQFNAGIEGRAQFAAICCGYEGNEAVEKAIVSMPGKKREALLDLCYQQTWADDPAPFFEAVTLEISGLQGRAMILGQMKSERATSPTTPSSSSSSSPDDSNGSDTETPAA